MAAQARVLLCLAFYVVSAHVLFSGRNSGRQADAGPTAWVLSTLGSSASITYLAACILRALFPTACHKYQQIWELLHPLVILAPWTWSLLMRAANTQAYFYQALSHAAVLPLMGSSARSTMLGCVFLCPGYLYLGYTTVTRQGACMAWGPWVARSLLGCSAWLLAAALMQLLMAELDDSTITPTSSARRKTVRGSDMGEAAASVREWYNATSSATSLNKHSSNSTSLWARCRRIISTTPRVWHCLQQVKNPVAFGKSALDAARQAIAAVSHHVDACQVKAKASLQHARCRLLLGAVLMLVPAHCILRSTNGASISALELFASFLSIYMLGALEACHLRSALCHKLQHSHDLLCDLLPAHVVKTLMESGVVPVSLPTSRVNSCMDLVGLAAAAAHHSAGSHRASVTLDARSTPLGSGSTAASAAAAPGAALPAAPAAEAAAPVPKNTGMDMTAVAQRLQQLQQTHQQQAQQQQVHEEQAAAHDRPKYNPYAIIYEREQPGGTTPRAMGSTPLVNSPASARPALPRSPTVVNNELYEHFMRQGAAASTDTAAQQAAPWHQQLLRQHEASDSPAIHSVLSTCGSRLRLEVVAQAADDLDVAQADAVHDALSSLHGMEGLSSHQGRGSSAAAAARESAYDQHSEAAAAAAAAEASTGGVSSCADPPPPPEQQRLAVADVWQEFLDTTEHRRGLARAATGLGGEEGAASRLQQELTEGVEPFSSDSAASLMNLGRANNGAKAPPAAVCSSEPQLHLPWGKQRQQGGADSAQPAPGQSSASLPVRVVAAARHWAQASVSSLLGKATRRATSYECGSVSGTDRSSQSSRPSLDMGGPRAHTQPHWGGTEGLQSPIAAEPQQPPATAPQAASAAGPGGPSRAAAGAEAAANEASPGLPAALSLAEWHESCTIIFADIVGFTEMSQQVHPQLVMRMLNSLYTRFDDVSKRFHVYKVETIGDCYMACTGVLQLDPDHARNALEFAAAIRRQAQKVLMPTTNEHVKLRVGLHSGRVMSGLVGKIRRQFRIYGDSVNTASRMESTGAPWAIHLSEDTYKLVHHLPYFHFTERGTVWVKGKGQMNTWWAQHIGDLSQPLDGPHPGADADGVAEAQGSHSNSSATTLAVATASNATVTPSLASITPIVDNSCALSAATALPQPLTHACTTPAAPELMQLTDIPEHHHHHRHHMSAPGLNAHPPLPPLTGDMLLPGCMLLAHDAQVPEGGQQQHQLLQPRFMLSATFATGCSPEVAHASGGCAPACILPLLAPAPSGEGTGAGGGEAAGATAGDIHRIPVV